MDTVQTWQTAYRFYRIDRHTFTQRELKPAERLIDMGGNEVLLPEDSRARLRNEFLTLQYLHQKTTIPVPRPIEYVVEDNIAILTTCSVAEPAIALSDHVEKDRESVIAKIGDLLISDIIPALNEHTSHRLGGMDPDEQGLLLPPRLTYGNERAWPRVTSSRPDFHLCHNDLGQSNIFIDPTSHKILAIIDWEYAGY